MLHYRSEKLGVRSKRHPLEGASKKGFSLHYLISDPEQGGRDGGCGGVTVHSEQFNSFNCISIAHNHWYSLKGLTGRVFMTPP